MEIREHYARCEPRLEYARHVETIAHTLPEWVISGIGLVLLRDSFSLSRKEARETLASGVPVCEASGVYYRAHQGDPARIELFLDTILGIWPQWVIHVPILRYEIVGRVFCHELGHHVYARKHPTAPANEREASAIGKALLSDYLRVRYKRWLPLIHPIRWVYKLISMIVGKPRGIGIGRRSG